MAGKSMRFLRTILWAAVGAVPGLIVFAVPGIVESQGENLALVFGGFLLAIIGAVIGGVVGSRKDAKTRWRVAGETTLVVVVSVALFVITARSFRNVVIGAVFALVPSVVAVALRRRSGAKSEEGPASV